MENTLGQRIDEFIKFLNSNRAKFAAEIGMAKSTMKSICEDKGSPQISTINHILEKFPQLNKSWLYFGEGSMVLNKEQNIEPERFFFDKKMYRSGIETVESQFANDGLTERLECENCKILIGTIAELRLQISVITKALADSQKRIEEMVKTKTE